MLPYIWYCHRLPERSFVYHGKQFPVCARCTGVWIGYGLGLIIALLLPLSWQTSVLLGVALLVPAAIDGGTQLVHWRTSTNWLRLITGILMGIGEVLILLPGALFVAWLGYQFGQSVR